MDKTELTDNDIIFISNGEKFNSEVTTYLNMAIFPSGFFLSHWGVSCCTLIFMNSACFLQDSKLLYFSA